MPPEFDSCDHSTSAASPQTSDTGGFYTDIIDVCSAAFVGLRTSGGNMKNIGGAAFVAALLGTLALSSRLGLAQAESSCAGLPTYTDLKNAMIIASGPSSGIGDPNRGFHNNMWGTI